MRFRLACELFGTEDGWYVDNVRFYDDLHTVTNTACVNDLTQLRCSQTTTIVEEVVSSTNNPAVAPIKVSLFPNPTNGMLKLQIREVDIQRLEVSVKALDGRLLLNRTENNVQDTQLDLSAYDAGIYFIEIITDQGTITERVIVK